LTAADRVAAGTDRLARAVFALLVVACFAAFFLTQRLKHTPTAVQTFKLTPFFSPTPAGHIKEERISFKVARSDDVTVTIVDSAGADVATLVRRLAVVGYKPLSLRWNGRLGVARRYSVVGVAGGHASILPANRGRLAPPGEYRVRVTLRHRRRSILSPRSFTLVR
jgi:hypothetical protein